MSQRLLRCLRTIDLLGLKSKAKDRCLQRSLEAMRTDTQHDCDSGLAEAYDWFFREDPPPEALRWAKGTYGTCGTCLNPLTYDDNLWLPEWMGDDQYCSSNCEHTARTKYMNGVIDEVMGNLGLKSDSLSDARRHDLIGELGTADYWDEDRQYLYDIVYRYLGEPE